MLDSWKSMRTMVEASERPFGVSATRNSGIRRKTAFLTEGLASIIDKKIPSLTPTHLNITGALFVTAGSALVSIPNRSNLSSGLKRKILEIALITGGSALDAVDGPLARRKEKINPGSVDFKRGQINDVLSDRVQETAEAFSRGINAHGRDDRWGEFFAFATNVTSTWTSISRAYAETQGKAVLESGKGIFGLVGTRPGRAVLGGLATLYPEPGGIPLQLGADILMAASNVITTVDRLKTAFSNKEATLSQEVRKEAKTRLAVLGIFTAVTDFIGLQTEFDIDAARRTVILKNPNKPTLVRTDGTTKDIDLVIFTPDRDKFEEAKKYFRDWENEVIGFPPVSVEAAFHPDWPLRKKWKQFVTAFEIGVQGLPSLAFGKIKQPIRPSSIEPWALDLGEGIRITAFHPLAHALCYGLRVPSGIKKKDKEAGKIDLLSGFAAQTINAGIKKGINYNDIFADWANYIWILRHEPDSLTRVKAAITNLYWNTVGTYVAHRARGNKFTG